MNRAELKLNAKESLRGKYGEATKMLLIYYIISWLITFIIGKIVSSEDNASLLATIANLIYGGLIQFGYCSFFLKIYRNE